MDTNPETVDLPPAPPPAIRHGAYAHSSVQKETGCKGWFEPNSEFPAWILFYYEDGSGILYSERTETGAVLGDGIKLASSLPIPSKE